MIAAAFAAAAVFNLACHGTEVRVETTGSTLAERLQAITDASRTEAGRPYSTAYRVDLERRRWCYDLACDISFPIAAVTDVSLTLQEDKTGSGAGTKLRRILINRENGEYREWRVDPGVTETVKGTCEQRPFTGLPKPRF